jgi:hypothetical protein
MAHLLGIGAWFAQRRPQRKSEMLDTRLITPSLRRKKWTNGVSQHD